MCPPHAFTFHSDGPTSAQQVSHIQPPALPSAHSPATHSSSSRAQPDMTADIDAILGAALECEESALRKGRSFGERSTRICVGCCCFFFFFFQLDRACVCRCYACLPVLCLYLLMQRLFAAFVAATSKRSWYSCLFFLRAVAKVCVCGGEEGRENGHAHVHAHMPFLFLSQSTVSACPV